MRLEGDDVLKSISTLGRIAIVAILLGGPAQAQQTGEMVSRFSSIWASDCIEAANGAAEDQDWIRYRCEGQGGVPVLLFFSDGTRLSLRFGDHDPGHGYYVADREQNWPVEWRGRMVQGGFVPRAAIVRMRNYGEFEGDRQAGSRLVVFKIEGGSCVVGEVQGNEQARQLADDGECGSAN